MRKRPSPERRRLPNTAKEADRLLKTERARYSNMESAFRRYCQGLLIRYENGRIDRKDFIKAFSQELYRYQARAYLSGRRMAGRFDSKIDADEEKMLHGQHSREMKFFHNFVRDIDAGKGRMQYKHRMDLYALGGYSIYLRGAVGQHPEAKKIKWGWIIHPEAEHCETCERNAELSKERGGFTIEEVENVYGYPGERTICGNRCRCHLKPMHQKGRNPKRTGKTKYTDDIARAYVLSEVIEWAGNHLIKRP